MADDSTATVGIRLRGVREAGLSGIDLLVPLRRVVCLAGPVGAGARTLAEVVLLGESRRRYLLSLTPFERERIGGIGTQADVDGIDGLPPAQPLPALAVGDATVASRLHIVSDLTRLVRARSQVSCVHCSGKCISFHEEDVSRLVEERFGDEAVLVVAPMELDAAAVPGVIGELERAGFRRIRIDGRVLRLDAVEEVASWTVDGILQVVVDRLSTSGRTRSRVGEAVRTARAIAGGRTLLVGDADQVWVDSRRACVECGRICEEPDWDRLVCGEFGSNSVQLDGRPVAEMMADLRLRDLASLTESRQDGEARRLARAGEICGEMALAQLPVWRLLAELSHGEQLLLGIAAARVTGLTGVLHVVLSPPSALDESCRRLVYDGLRTLVREGASVVVVDSDADSAEWVDDVVTIGVSETADVMLAGRGSALVASEVEQIVVEAPGEGEVPVPAQRVVVPLGALVVVTGPSGSGKSRLVSLLRSGLSGKSSAAVRRVRAPAVDRVVDVTSDGSRRGGLLVELLGAHRALARMFADGSVARENHHGTDHFLLEKPGGRCPACEGQGTIRHELGLVEDVEVTCSVCDGRRFRDEVLTVTAHGVTIAEAYGMTVGEAEVHFGRERSVKEIFSAAVRCGLARRPVDVSSQALDGVERLLARLARHQLGVRRGDLVLVDRPVAGCDPAATACVINALRRLVTGGASVVVTDAVGSVGVHADAIVALEAPPAA
ncbi:MAG: hypothetical protein VCF24_25505 [Candidatus Latescibacterota bacterium]